MKKFIYKGNAVMASSKEEAISSIIASMKVIATASDSVKDWINRVFAGVLAPYVNSDAESKILEKSSQEVSNILTKFLSWNDSEKEFYVVAPFIKEIPLSKIKTFDDFREYLRKKAFEKVAKQYEVISDEIFNVFVAYLEESDLGTQQDILERLVDNVDVEYNYDKYYESKLKRHVSIDLTIPEVMNSLFGTQDLATIAKKFVDKKLNVSVYEALAKCFTNVSPNIDLTNFDKVLLCFNHILSSLSLRTSYIQVTLRQILSVSDQQSPLAVEEFNIPKDSKVYLCFNYPKRLEIPVKLNSDIKVKPRVLEFA